MRVNGDFHLSLTKVEEGLALLTKITPMMPAANTLDQNNIKKIEIVKNGTGNIEYRMT